ncbi:hypothetical protein SynRS9902_02594 [Synechococcus sp. RS9902]|nr:hypothetical protein SynRS9902_02594 [Synechococcus sp. RS9902]
MPVHKDPAQERLLKSGARSEQSLAAAIRSGHASGRDVVLLQGAFGVDLSLA